MTEPVRILVTTAQDSGTEDVERCLAQAGYPAVGFASTQDAARDVFVSEAPDVVVVVTDDSEDRDGSPWWVVGISREFDVPLVYAREHAPDPPARGANARPSVLDPGDVVCGRSSEELRLAIELALCQAELTRANRAHQRSENGLRLERKRLERRLADLERTNSDLESFNLRVGHELGTPLRSIKSYSKALLQHHGDHLDEHARSQLARVHRAGLQLGEIIDALLDFSRTTWSEIHFYTCNVSAMSEAVVADLRRLYPERPVETVVEADMSAHADPRLLRVILHNLLDNAWKFTAHAEPARVEVGKTQHQGKPAFFIRDNGVGFDMEHVDAIFTPFSSVHDRHIFAGNGMGLTTVRRIIQRHGGSVWAEAAVGGGATFTFTLM